MQLALRGALLCSLAAAVAAAGGQARVLARDAEACPYSINPAAAALGRYAFVGQVDVGQMESLRDAASELAPRVEAGGQTAAYAVA